MRVIGGDWWTKAVGETAEAREGDLARGLGALLHPTPTHSLMESINSSHGVVSLCAHREFWKAAKQIVYTGYPGGGGETF